MDTTGSSTDSRTAPTVRAVLKAAEHYFHDGRCSGHDQWNGRYCRDVAGWERWCIHCAGLMLLRTHAETLRLWQEQDAVLQQLAALVDDEHVTDPAGVARAITDALGMAEDAVTQWRDQLAAMTVQRDEYKALASVGTWHADCRPNRRKAAEEIAKSQAIINKLADEIAALKSSSPSPQTWQPISTAPKDGTKLLLLWGDGKKDTGFWWTADRFSTGHWHIAGEEDREPTHWMPLPSSPLPSPSTKGSE